MKHISKIIHTRKNRLQLEKCATLGKMCQTSKNGSKFQKSAYSWKNALGKIRTWKNALQLEKCHTREKCRVPHLEK